jgi:dethiobiotin synthetase
MSSAVLVTGTGTGVGKTVASLALMRAWQAKGLVVQGMKPVAAGAYSSPGGWVNQDAQWLRNQSSNPLAYELHNPYLFRAAVAPHLAAAQENRPLEFAVMGQALKQLEAVSDRVLVEGAGGFLVPLGAEGNWGDFCRYFSMPVILVVGVELGCINHALLTEEAILARGIECLGWVATILNPHMEQLEGNLETLKTFLKARFLGTVPHSANPLGVHFMDG